MTYIVSGGALVMGAAAGAAFAAFLNFRPED
jgi:hypothetical protein